MNCTQNLPPAIFLMGPTAAGKTDLAMHLFDNLPCDIISVDSALIYRDMNIGTAKPDPDMLAKYPHRLVDILDPAESYSVAEFCQDALKEMQQISASGRIPLLVGGTMMYYNALQKGLAQLPEADDAIRLHISAQAEAEGWPAIHAELAKVDPESAHRLKPNDSQRLQRALEVYRVSGKTMTELWAEQAAYQLPYNVINLSIAPSDRSVLHKRIEQRFHIMLEQGFIEEVKALYARGDLNTQMPSVRCVGYRQAWSYLDGEWDYETMVHKGIVATRQLAKRQITWLRGWENLQWLETEDKDNLQRCLKIVESGII